jgi:hypothetical protein
VPGALSRRQRFDDVAVAAVAHLASHAPEVDRVDVLVEDVPPIARGAESVPLGRVVRRYPRNLLVLHRRPIVSAAADDDQAAALVRDVLAELLADLVLRAPEDVDPHYPREPRLG